MKKKIGWVYKHNITNKYYSGGKEDTVTLDKARIFGESLFMIFLSEESLGMYDRVDIDGELKRTRKDKIKKINLVGN